MKINGSYRIILAVCPLMGATTSLQQAVYLALFMGSLLIVSHSIFLGIKNIISTSYWKMGMLLIMAIWGTLGECVMSIFWKNTYDNNGLYMSISLVSLMILMEDILGRMAEKKYYILTMLKQMGFVLGILIFCGGVREYLGTGMLWGYPIGHISYPVLVLLLSSGGFWLLASLCMLFQIRET